MTLRGGLESRGTRGAYLRFRVLTQEVAKFGVVGGLAVGITIGGANAEAGAPVPSTTS